MHKNVPPAHFGYMASGIDDEITLRANREGFLKFALRPRRLVDVSKVDMSLEIFGMKYNSPIFVAPTAGLLSSRTGTRPLIFIGMAMMSVALAWLSVVTTPTVDYIVIVPAFIVAGIGMGLFFAPIANVVLSAVRREEEGKASGANNAIRELGGVFGVAVLASVFSANGSYATGQSFVDGLIPAMQIGAVVVGLGAVAALALGGRTRAVEATADEAAPEFEVAAA